MSADRKHGLGKGMSSLISGFDYDVQVENVITKTVHQATDEQKVLSLDVDKIRTNPNQPRKSFDEDELKGLSESIKAHGIIQPITVEEIAPGTYSIVAGERRYRAAKLAGLKKVPAVLVKLSELDRVEISLIENIQREDLNPIEEATTYGILINKYDLTQEQVAEKVGKSRSAVANSVRLLSLPDNIKDDLISGAMTAGHARALLTLKNPGDVKLLREKIIQDNLSVRDSEKMAEAYNLGHKIETKKKKDSKDPEIKEVEEKFISALGSRCEIKGTLKRGKLQIKYRNQRDLEKIYKLLSDGGALFEE